MRKKGVVGVIDCPVEELPYSDLEELYNIVREYSEKLGFTNKIAFDSNEAIGTTHILYRFHITIPGGYIGVRVVTRNRRVYRILYTIPDDKYLENIEFEKYDPSPDLTGKTPINARGQYYIDYPVVYASLGIPRVNPEKWVLTINGLVEKPVKLTLADLYSMELETIVIDFHCVTGWSVRNMKFTGVPLNRITELVKPRSDVEWIYAESLDGYSTIIPYREALNNGGILALEMNDKPLTLEHGYPARLVIPGLYGWKSIKWVHHIEFRKEYIDGYWEALGYHPRGRVDYEERFKQA